MPVLEQNENVEFMIFADLMGEEKDSRVAETVLTTILKGRSQTDSLISSWDTLIDWLRDRKRLAKAIEETCRGVWQ